MSPAQLPSSPDNTFVALCFMQEKNPEQAVRRYYDHNTRKFLSLSRKSAPKAIHQPLYESQKMSLEEALHTHHRELLRLLPDTADMITVLDLGCGVGESMIYLARHTVANFRYYGITLSGQQVSRATASIRKSGLDDRVQIFEGSFHHLPQMPPIDLAYAIESLIHSDDVSGFFAQVSSVLKPGGRLVVFDDFLSRHSTPNNPRILQDLNSGWLANTLMTPKSIESAAKLHHLSLESAEDLSAMLRLYRMRDQFVHALVPLARPFMKSSEYCRFLIGGDARQRAYRAGILGYFRLVFVKR